MSEGELSVYDIVGGDETFKQLVENFYARVEQDERLRALFPDDLEEGKHWQYLFLRQFFGGPADYHLERGHPRLRMRHAPFKIDTAARDAWLENMLAAIDAVGIQDPARQMMRNYFERAATHMINSYGIGG